MPHSSGEICFWKIYEKFKCLKTGGKEKWRNKGMNSQQQQYKRYILSQSTCLTSFQYLGLTVPEKSVMKNCNLWKLERKMKKGMNKQQHSLIAVYTIHPPIFHVCTKFRLSRTHNSWEKCDKILFENWRERKLKKQISSSSLILVYTIHPPIVHVCNKFQPCRPHSSSEKCDKNFNIWKLETKKNEELRIRIRIVYWWNAETTITHQDLWLGN